jgi:hypothetical protein
VESGGKSVSVSVMADEAMDACVMMLVMVVVGK